jgi:Protein of unknown function (DUF3300)
VSTQPAAASFSGNDAKLTASQLEFLVGRIALYPDDLFAVVLPASTQPLQIVDAQRFLEQRKADANVQPPKTWDPSVVALLNYPEILALMTSDLLWLQQLGTSVVVQQADVMDAVQSFRRKALAAGNLKSDDKQLVSEQPGGSGTPEVVVIESTSPEFVYVPVYEPTTVVHVASSYPYQWSAPYNYYYDPWAPFYMGAFFGAAIGFGCDWDDHNIYLGDVSLDRDKLKQRLDASGNSGLAERIGRNPENRWRADRSNLERMQAARGTFQQAPGVRNVGAVDRGLSSGAFSGIDRGAAASRFSARGGASLAQARAGGGFRGGGRGGRR